jgi:hypothetical protein
MSYAVRIDGKGWRVVSDVSQVGDGEFYADTTPTSSSVPDSVSLTQAKLALLQAGKFNAVNIAVNNAVATLPGTQGQEAQIYWTSTDRVHRSSPLLQAVAASAGLSSADLDSLFILAATL